MGVVGTITSQIPFAGGVARAQDYPIDGGGGGRGLVQGLVLSLVGLGVYTTLTDKTPPPPPTPEGGTAPASTTPTIPTTLPASVFDAAAGNADLSTFASNAERAGLAEELKQPGPYTIFAPTNAAFASLPGDTLANLQKPENLAQLRSLMRYHVVQGRYTMQDLKNLTSGTQLPTLAGSPITVTVMGTAPNQTVAVNGVQVIDSDIPAANGVIHPLGQVLTPPAPPADAATPAPAE
jgi:uncharacterized surface protein with fasciclin (FAS1) repeats